MDKADESTYDGLKQLVLTKFQRFAAKLQQQFPSAFLQIGSDQGANSPLDVWLEISAVKDPSKDHDRVIFFGLHGDNTGDYDGNIDFSTGGGEIIADGPTLKGASKHLDEPSLEAYGAQLQTFLDAQTGDVERVLAKR